MKDLTSNKIIEQTTNLQAFKKNITSQNGEDGIIEKIFEIIGCQNKVCVEFGACDGRFLSNTWNLRVNKGWKGILIEADPVKAKRLCKDYPGDHCINRYVSHEGPSSLDNILGSLYIDIPQNFDLLSIDVDGNDYHIWKSFKNYSPSVVIVECNPTIPPYVELAGDPNNTDIGCSALALVKLAHKKRYKLVAMTKCNLFFVQDTKIHPVELPEVNLFDVFDYSALSTIVSTFDRRSFVLVGKNSPKVSRLMQLAYFLSDIKRKGFKFIFIKRKRALSTLLKNLTFDNDEKPTSTAANSGDK